MSALLALALLVAAPPQERGLALGLFSGDPDYDYRTLLEEIAAQGATDVSITYVWWQQDLHASVIEPKPIWSATDAQIEASIRTARKLGLRVTLFPILRLMQAGPGEWRGKIAPHDLDAWWLSYQHYILHATALARKAGAQRLAIGSELVSREHERERWREVIDRIRLAAPELELLYSANWDHFEPVSFWDLVDVVGLTAYWELTRDSEASIDALALAWTPVKTHLERFSKGLGRPLVITEIGYPSQDGGTVWPWDQTRKAKIDLEEQRRGYEAFVRAWSDVPFLRGVYFWNWFGFGGPEDGDYTPRNKPAAEVIRRWFGAPGFPSGDSSRIKEDVERTQDHPRREDPSDGRPPAAQARRRADRRRRHRGDRRCAGHRRRADHRDQQPPLAGLRASARAPRSGAARSRRRA